MGKKVASLADFLFEVGMLSQTPRSGFFFLGSGQQSVAEHVHRAIYAGFVLAMMDGKVDVSKVLKMCLFHDLSEARTSDLNYVHQKYNQRQDSKAIQDLAERLEFGPAILKIVAEYEERQTKESLLAKDADNIEWILALKEQVDTGNSRAEAWLHIAVKRLKTGVAKKLAAEIVKTNSDRWWFGDGQDDWWVNRKKPDGQQT